MSSYPMLLISIYSQGIMSSDSGRASNDLSDEDSPPQEAFMSEDSPPPETYLSEHSEEEEPKYVMQKRKRSPVKRKPISKAKGTPKTSTRKGKRVTKRGQPPPPSNTASETEGEMAKRIEEEAAKNKAALEAHM